MSLVIKIAGNSDEFKKELESVKSQTKSLDNQLSKIAKVSGIAFAALTGTVGLAVKQFADFDNQIRAVKTNLDESSFGAKGLAKGFEEMKKGILDVAGAYPVSIEGLNKALFDTVSAGIDANEAVGAVEAAARLATAGLTDVSIATDGLTSALNAYGLSASEADLIAAKFFQANKFGKTTVEELASGFGTAASTAAGMGVSLDELLASVSALTLAGIKTSEAYTGVRAVIANIAKPTEDATKEAERLGVAFDANALRSQGLQRFLEGLTQAKGFTKDSAVKLFGSIQGLNAAFALTGNQAGKFKSILAELNNEQKLQADLDKAVLEMKSSLSSQIQILRNQFEKLAIVVGAHFAPVLEKAAILMGELISWFSNNPEVAKFGAYVLGAGVALTGLVTALALGAKAFLTLREAMILTRVIAAALGLTIKGALITSGIGLLVIAIGTLVYHWEAIWIRMQSIFVAFVNNIRPMLIGLGELLIGVLTGDLVALKSGWDQIRGAFSTAMDSYNTTLIQKKTEIQAAELELDLANQEQKTLTDEERHLAEMARLDQKELEKQELKTVHRTIDAENDALHLQNKKTIDQEAHIQDLKDLMARHGEKITMLSGMTAGELAEMGKKVKTMEDIEREHRQRMVEKQIEQHNVALENERKYGKAMGAIMTELGKAEVALSSETGSRLIAMQRSKGETLKAIGKAAAVTQIGIDTAKGAIAAYSSLAGIPIVGPGLGIAAAAAIIAFGAEQVSQVLGANQGGRVPSMGRAGVDSVPAFLTPGETVAPAQNYDELINAVSNSRLQENALSDNRGGRQNSAVSSVSGGTQTVRVLIEMSDQASRILTAQQIRDIQIGTSRALSAG